MDNNLKVTTIEELMEYKKGVLTRLPDFDAGQPFYARITRPSLLKLVRDGKIPNHLIAKANDLFAGKAKYSVDDTEALSELFEVLEIFADSCIVSPTLSEIREAGMELTDEQLMFIYNYAQVGAKALENFRQEQGDIKPNINGETLPQEAE